MTQDRSPLFVQPVTLRGKRVELSPLAEEHAAELWAATLDTEVWPWMPVRPSSQDEFRRMIGGVRELSEHGKALAFAIRSIATGQLIGSTGYWNVEPPHRRVEIGMTWITRRFQRTAVNTEMKYLMLRHAFEELSCIRVEFKTDARNARSRAALKRIGAKEEGTLRCHMVLPDGFHRDSVYFSVVESEWPEVKGGLEALLAER